MEGYGPETFGKLVAAAYDLQPEEHPPVEVDVLADLAAGGKVLELAVGTGRVAVPLAARGLSVHGIDASPEMIAKMRERPGGEAIPASIGDFADVAVDGEFDLIYLVFNTLFNLTSQEDQLRCFRNVAKHLTEKGRFVIDTIVPDPKFLSECPVVKPNRIAMNYIVFEAAIHDPVKQRIDYQYVTMTRKGTRLFPLPWRYAWPAEIDLMAQLAGLELHDRWGGWDRSPFSAASTRHVSVYGWPRTGATLDRTRAL